jgi:hypothetical protein
LELDETGEDTDFHHFGMGSGSSLLSSPRYSKSGIKRSQTFSSLSSLVHEAEQDELENHPPTGTNNPDANTCASRKTSHSALKCRPHSTTSGSIWIVRWTPSEFGHTFGIEPRSDRYRHHQ